MTRKIKVPAGFRRLKWNEVVNEGDFVINDQQQVVLWEGLHGFFADNYVKPIYRATKEIPGAKLPQTAPSALPIPSSSNANIHLLKNHPNASTSIDRGDGGETAADTADGAGGRAAGPDSQPRKVSREISC